MAKENSKRNWTPIIFGIILVVCGWAIGVFPGLALVTIAMMAGVSFLVAGVGGFISYIQDSKTQEISKWSLVYAGIDVLIGLMMLLHPLANAAVIPWLTGTCFIVLGIFQIIVALQLKKASIAAWGWAVVYGLLYIVFGGLFFGVPSLLAILFSFVTIFRGVSMIISGFSAK